MRIVPLANSTLRAEAYDLFEELGFNWNVDEAWLSIDTLHVFAGRNCYQSFDAPNPKTRSLKDYLKNILNIGHESVLEHGTVTFFVEGISRNLLLELERHRHISLSVLSTRYVDCEVMEIVIHPNTPLRFVKPMHELMKKAKTLASEMTENLLENGFNKKQAREVGRQILPGNTETKFVITANIRAWRYIVKARNYEGADAEIQLFAQEILKHLKVITPYSVQDL